MVRQLSVTRRTNRRAKHQNRGGARRGVSSVLAMMFMVIFGSLAAAMAVVAQGNLRTADSSLKVSRAMSAAETGLVFAAHRLHSEAKRFVVEKGVIDAAYAEDLWLGTYNESIDGAVTVLPPDGYTTATDPDGIMYGVRDAHLADTHDIEVEPGDSSLPTIDEVLGVLITKPIALDTDEFGQPDEDGAYFRLRYEMHNEFPRVRVTATGVDGELSRTLQMDFRLDKKIKYAVISPNRIMIGKNVLVDGPLGSRYGLVGNELVPTNGDPLVMKSDFYYLDDNLDDLLDTLHAEIAEHDVDGDNRLRTGHPVESNGLDPDGLDDYNGDEYVDDFDLFLAEFDNDDDGQIVYDADLAAAAGLGILTEEFVDIDNQLCWLIDQFNADRDDDGDVDATDTALGYNDGVINDLDIYAKLHGHLAFAVTQADWETNHGESYTTVVQGPVRPGIDTPAVEFGKDDETLLEITTDMFNDSISWFDTESQTGADFATQTASGGTFTDAATNGYESVPYDAPGAYDWFERPKYEGYTFNNLRIPEGTNALFEDCVFQGVTYIETEVANTHENWNYAGAQTRIEVDPDVYEYPLAFEGLYAESGGAEVQDTKLVSNNIRFHNCVFLGSVSADKPNEYAHWRNKVQFTGTTRFFVDPTDDDLDPIDDADLITLLEAMDADDLAELAKSSILMPGWSIDVGNFTNVQATDPDDTPTVKLKGTIIAGILDVRGTADVHGTLLMTFRPTEGAGPLFYGGMPDVFNTTIGYFGPLDGDNEGMDPNDPDFNGFGEITLRYDEDADLPDGIPWPVGMSPEPLTYTEGGS